MRSFPTGDVSSPLKMRIVRTHIHISRRRRRISKLWEMWHCCNRVIVFIFLNWQDLHRSIHKCYNRFLSKTFFSFEILLSFKVILTTTRWMILAIRSCRKTPETAGAWKQYFERKLSEFFPVDSCQLPVLSGRNQPEIIGKISGRNTASIKSAELPGTVSFEVGLFNLGIWHNQILVHN